MDAHGNQDQRIMTHKLKHRYSFMFTDPQSADETPADFSKSRPAMLE